MKNSSKVQNLVAAFVVGQLLAMSSAMAGPGSFREDYEMLKGRAAEVSVAVKASVQNAISSKVQPVVTAYDKSSASSKAIYGGATFASAVALQIGAAGAVVVAGGEKLHKFWIRAPVAVAAVGVVVVIDGAAQGLLKRDSSYFVSVVERLVNLFVDPSPVATGTLSDYYATDAGFTQYLQIDTKSAEYFASVEPKLAARVHGLADFIRTTEAMGGAVQLVVVQ